MVSVSDRQLWWLDQGTKRPGPLATVDRDALAAAVAEIKELRKENARLRALNERIAHDELLAQLANEDMRRVYGGNNGTGTVDQGRDT
jgi:transposase-like protein